jgi:hypothetical protein
MQCWTFGAGLTMLAPDPRPVIFSSSALVWPLKPGVRPHDTTRAVHDRSQRLSA